ncbi:hypothetical protein ACS0TY_017284 [Phlomoides rotata]
MFPSWKLLFTIALFSLLLSLTSQQSFDYPTANLSTSWTNTPTLRAANFSTIGVRLALLRGTAGARFASGYYCNGTCNTFMFSIFIVFVDGDGEIIFNQAEFPQVVWSANRNRPVRENAKLELTNAGDLVLRDADGSLAWSSNTAGRSVVGLNLTETGNLVLHDAQNRVVWQSLDHPSDALVPGQIILSGTNLTASRSSTNWSEPGQFILSMTEEGLVASILSNPPQVYLEYLFINGKQNQEQSSAEYENGSLTLSQNSNNPQNQDIRIPIPPARSAQFIKFGPDGHLRVFQWSDSWREVADLLTSDFDPCSYPLVCGRYGICSSGQCSCPVSTSGGASFRPVNNRRPDFGCSEVTPITCNASRRHRFLDVEDVTYFSFRYDIMNTDMKRCKEACLKNCSCRAAVFLPGVNPDAGGCYLPNEIFSLIDKGNGLTRFNSSVALKVQIDPAKPSCKRNNGF